MADQMNRTTKVMAWAMVLAWTGITLAADPILTLDTRDGRLLTYPSRGLQSRRIDCTWRSGSITMPRRVTGTSTAVSWT